MTLPSGMDCTKVGRGLAPAGDAARGITTKRAARHNYRQILRICPAGASPRPTLVRCNDFISRKDFHL